MDAAGEEGGITYGQVEQCFHAMEGPSAQERINYIVPFLISLLPPRLVPAPDDAGATDDSDDERFSLTSSSDSEVPEAGADSATFPPAAPGDDEDHISRLPDALLSDIISRSRLPTKEAARTVVLSTRWRDVWAATPLLVDEAHLVGADGPRDIPIVRAVSRCVAAHPGPVRSVRITRVSFYHHEYALRRLVVALAAKDVQDLILFNRPWPLDMPLPDDILRCASLERLYLGVWLFPKITATRPLAFHKLRELGLFHCIVRDEELDAVLGHCPKLEVLSLVMSFQSPSRLRVGSRSLQVAVEWMSTLDEIVLEDAPCLERLIFQTIAESRPIKIVRAPRLEVLGFLDLNLHTLEIGGTAIRAGMNVGARAMVPSLKILAVKVQFARNQEAKMLPTLLRCFPRLETLHIMPVLSKSNDSAHDLEFWESLGSCECLESHLKTVVLHGHLMQNHGVGFKKYITREGKALETVIVLCRDEMTRDLSSASLDERNVALGGGRCDVSFCVVNSPWSFQNASDLALHDPFCVVRAEA
ncbi:LOW QUALITY PROTEIN: F-box/LRR-repeat protein At5g02910-like [Phragmites australis]|uniref:LOW QUALITY PROTEIN: F-box/LRR-repeat protein At5g02910-like n=1 Tax=Phragmites australis TaxID=29695 RepID=UPI002D7761BE|nr:LOW QUALITY PROTEIN: F-box/LRR-repeat protein At5g02910-like [Phragmites australis]